MGKYWHRHKKGAEPEKKKNKTDYVRIAEDLRPTHRQLPFKIS